MRRRADFDRVFRQGRHNSSRLMAVRSVPNDLGFTRLAIMASRRVGNAVTRNRVRRRLTEAFRRLSWAEGYDIVIQPRPEAAKATFWDLKAELTLLLGRARLLLSQDP